MELAKRIAIAKHINADHNDLAIKTLHSNANGAALYHVYDISNNEHRYVIEGVEKSGGIL